MKKAETRFQSGMETALIERRFSFQERLQPRLLWEPALPAIGPANPPIDLRARQMGTEKYPIHRAPPEVAFDRSVWRTGKGVEPGACCQDNRLSGTAA